MNKRDYELIARIIADHREGRGSIELCDTQDLVVSLARGLRTDNLKFNPDRFVTACGYDCKASEL